MIGHFAGVPITLDGRYVRQLCAWCGDVLVDVDATRVAVPVDQLSPDGAITVATWPEGSIVCVDGAASWSVPVGSAANTFICGFIEIRACESQPVAPPELTAAELDEWHAGEPELTELEIAEWRAKGIDLRSSIDRLGEPDHGPSSD